MTTPAIFPPAPLNVQLATDLASRAQHLGQVAVARASALYQNGVFYQGYAGPGTSMLIAAGMASLARYTTNSALRERYVSMIKEVVEWQINVHIMPDKQSFPDGGTDPTGWGGVFPDQTAQTTPASPSPNITIPMIEALAWIVQQMPDGSLDGATRSRWVKICQDCCTKLDHWYDGGSITTYYINANYQCALMGAYWGTAAISSGSARDYFVDAYERAYRFVIQPAVETAPSSTWAGWGLTIDVAGSTGDWSDYEVHLTETNSRDPATDHNDFDWQYSQAQLYHLSTTFVQNRDARVARLINGISNKIYPRIMQVPGTIVGIGSFPEWTLNATSGSRQNGPRAMDAPWAYVQGLLLGKLGRRELLSDAQLVSMWDDGNGMVNSVLGGSPTIGHFPLIADLLGVGVVLQAAHHVLDSVVADA